MRELFFSKKIRISQIIYKKTHFSESIDNPRIKQTLPTVGDETVQNLFNRANTLRLKSGFDKAESVYNKIPENLPDDAEAHWGVILCKYGIEYVEDPKTYERDDPG